jgi:hypothetical protein
LSNEGFRGPVSAAAACLGILVVFSLLGPTLAGNRAAKPSADDLKRRLEQLRSLPYATVSPTEHGPGKAGVSVHDTSRAYRGYNLYCVAGQPAVILMDMDGTVVHRWTCPVPGANEFDHAVLLPGGNLVAIAGGQACLVLSWDSKTIKAHSIGAHHDIAMADDSTYYTISYGLHKYRGFYLRFDKLVQLSPRMEPLREWSTYDNLEEIKMKFNRRSFAEGLIDSIIAAGGSPGDQQTQPGRFSMRAFQWGMTAYDYFHVNTVTLIPDTPLGREDDRFRAGNILTCARNVNQVVILDSRSFEILWVWGEGILQWPHNPTMLENGNILVFDNGVLRKSSKVIEINPRTLETEWEYTGSPPESFYSSTKGSAQRLPNGNTLICEGERGRAFEVTPDHEVVWEWFNPMFVNSSRLTVYRMTRLDPATVEPLLGR